MTYKDEIDHKKFTVASDLSHLIEGFVISVLGDTETATVTIDREFPTSFWINYTDGKNTMRYVVSVAPEA